MFIYQNDCFYFIYILLKNYLCATIFLKSKSNYHYKLNVHYVEYK